MPAVASCPRLPLTFRLNPEYEQSRPDTVPDRTGIMEDAWVWVPESAGSLPQGNGGSLIKVL